MVILGIGALFIGVFVNQILTQGVKWSVLLLSLPGSSSMKDLTTISVDSAMALSFEKRVIFVDVRPEEEYEIDRIQGAKSVPFEKILKGVEQIEFLDKKQPMILYCFDSDCKKAYMAARYLIKKKFREVMILREGFAGWLERNFPVEVGGEL
jgi:rhodanese-related sulfurtransferase